VRLKVTGLKRHVVRFQREEYVLVEIETIDGVKGLGEIGVCGKTHAVLGAVRDLEPLVIGQDAFAIGAICRAMTPHPSSSAGAITQSIRSGIEMALWDIKGKALGVPVHKCFGGRVRDRIRLCATGMPDGSSDQLVQAAGAVAAQGFTALKWCPFPSGSILKHHQALDAVKDQVHAVREAVGPDMDLVLDARCRLSPALAILAAERLHAFRISILANPCEPSRLTCLADVTARSRIPTGAGAGLPTRAAFHALLEERAAGVLFVDAAHCGGITEARLIAAAAEVQYTSVVACHSGGWIRAAAATQYAATTPNLLFQEFVYDPAFRSTEWAQPAAHLQPGGYLAIPERPGLGIEVDWEGMKRAGALVFSD
jgi:galactonate dehydratase